MAKLTPIEMAQQAALRGDSETAVTELSALQAQGNIGASAALAEIAAFKGQWQEALKNALLVIAGHDAVQILNVYQDMVMLAGLAGTKLGAWNDIQRIAETAAAELAEQKKLPGFGGAARKLAAFAASAGQGNLSVKNYVYGNSTLAQRKAKFEAALEALAQEKKSQFKTPAERATHLFGLAKVCGYYQGAVELYDKEEPSTIFDGVMFAASGLARCGRTEDAWLAIRTQLSSWWPVTETQIAPVELLTDEALGPLMTPERGEEVLRTKRGSAGLGK